AAGLQRTHSREQPRYPTRPADSCRVLRHGTSFLIPRIIRISVPWSLDTQPPQQYHLWTAPIAEPSVEPLGRIGTKYYLGFLSRPWYVLPANQRFVTEHTRHRHNEVLVPGRLFDIC